MKNDGLAEAPYASQTFAVFRVARLLTPLLRLTLFAANSASAAPLRRTAVQPARPIEDQR